MSPTHRRVVITGMGVISPLGNTKEALWDALVAGQSGVKSIGGSLAEHLPISFGAPAVFQGSIEDFGPLEKTQQRAIRKALKVMCRDTQMGVASAQLALADAGIAQGQLDPERTGVNFGTDYMLTDPEEFSEGVLACVDPQGQFENARWATNGMPKMSPLWLLKYLPNMPASHLAIFNDFRGPNNSLTLREAAAYAALAEAWQIILRGSADAMLVGATGSRLHPMKMLHAIQQEELAVANGDPSRACRPFDRDRTGMVLGEGAGTIVLEELSAAEARGARIYAEVFAGASSSVVGSSHLANRHRAMANVLRSVLRQADESPDGVGHIHAHALSTRTADIEEARAINDVFGDRPSPVPVTAAKSYFGNLGAGSAVVELVASLMALDHGRLFPVRNYENPDPECPLGIVTESTDGVGEKAISLSVTPQGQASAVLVGRIR